MYITDISNSGSLKLGYLNSAQSNARKFVALVPPPVSARQNALFILEFCLPHNPMSIFECVYFPTLYYHITLKISCLPCIIR